jgi:hypothetical protein
MDVLFIAVSLIVLDARIPAGARGQPHCDRFGRGL